MPLAKSSSNLTQWELTMKKTLRAWVPVWVDIESDSQRREMVALGTDLLHDTSVPIALHYAAMQLIGFRIQTKKELDACLDAMQYLGVELGVQNTAFLSCLQRTAVSFRQNFARIKLPN